MPATAAGTAPMRIWSRWGNRTDPERSPPRQPLDGETRLPTARLRFSRSRAAKDRGPFHDARDPPTHQDRRELANASRSARPLRRRLAMNRRFSLRRRRAVALALSACVLTVAAPTAVAQTTNQDLRSRTRAMPALAAEPRPAIRTCARRMPAMPRSRYSKRRSRRPGIATCARRMCGTPPAGSRRARCRLPRRLRSNAARWSQSKRAAARRSRSCSRPARC